MARDYKHRTQSKRNSKKSETTVAWWKWLLIFLLIGSFVWFLYYLGDSSPEETSAQIRRSLKKPTPEKPQTKRAEKKSRHTPKPQFEFYTILPETEVVVPEYEIKTRKREERVGKAPAAKYVLQAGSFRDYKQADKLKARLALMGIESRIEKARVGDSVWNRVKMGPFAQLANVDKLRTTLKRNNIDVVVMEVKN